MGSTPAHQYDITGLLQAWGKGDADALEKLTPLVYGELHRLANHYMAGENVDHTLQATALINEAYLRLIDWKAVRWQDRAHFFGVSANLMRRILVDYARTRKAAKRGHGHPDVCLDEAVVIAKDKCDQVIALDDALRRLAEIDARKAKVVELRFFAGLSLEETASVLNVSPFTVMRDWNLGKVWLLRDLSGDQA